MNIRIVIILFFIFSVFLSMGAVCADNMTEDANALLAIDDNDLSVAEDNDYVASDDSSFKDLNATVNSGNDVVELTRDYTFKNESDGDFVKGIVIDRDNLVISGNNHTVDGNNQARLFNISGHNIVIKDLIFKNAYDSAVTVYGSLKTSNVLFTNCSSDEGAAVYVDDAEYVSENDKFIANTAQSGVISSYDASITVSSGLFEGNIVDEGTINSETSALIIERSMFINNHNNWSSIYLAESNVNVSDTTFANSTSRYATAIYSKSGVTNIKKSRFINLAANITAGALGFKAGGDVVIEDCEFVNSTSRRNGGAVYIDIPAATDEYDGNILINNTVFERCFSEFGGAYLQLGGNLLILNSNFTDNHADYNGGAVYLSDTNSSIANCIFTGNNVNMTYEDYPTYGGAVFCDNSALDACDSKFTGNSAVEGGALYMYDTVYNLNNLEFNANGNAVRAFFDDGSKRSNLYGSDNISDDDFGNTVYYDVISGEGMALVLLNSTVNTTLPARYDLREENLVTPVKNQGHMGACWAFGSIAALESAILKAMNYTADFSENNMQNSMIMYSILGSKDECEGGTILNSLGYFLSWAGAFPSGYDEYDQLGKISALIRTPEDIHVQDIIIQSHVPGDADSITNVKELIYKYGAIGGYLFSKSSQDDGNPTGYYNENTSAEYVPDHFISNHAICVVGWDDNYPACNFAITPPGDGAWIVKNSWGTDWGDEGYFYVSYYDQTLCAFPQNLSESFMAFVLENDEAYNNNYQYDFSGLSGFYKGDYDKIFYLNTYDAYEDDLIAAVGTYFNQSGAEYTVNIYVNEELVYTQSGISPFRGYHTIKLDKYVSVRKGENFSASVRTNLMPFCSDSRVHYQEGSYMSDDGEVWSDLIAQDLVACIKVYTLPNLITAESIREYYSDSKPFIVNVTQANVNVSVSIRNVTITNLSDENGIAVFELPLLDSGLHVITTVCGNISVISTVNVLDTIDVDREITLACNACVDVNVTYYDKSGNVISTASFPLINQIGTYHANFTNCLTNQTVTSTITVVSRFAGNKNLDMYYFDASKYSLQVYGDDGNPADENQVVVIKVGSKTYNVKTDAEGVAALTIPKEITPGSYTITATYAGQTVKNTLKVRQSLSSKKVTVKKTAKKLVLKATLKNGKKAVKGKTITFRFNGKTYKAKTNSKGVASKTLKKNIIKKLKKGKTYTVKVTYLKNTIKTTVKVK